MSGGMPSSLSDVGDFLLLARGIGNQEEPLNDSEHILAHAWIDIANEHGIGDAMNALLLLASGLFDWLLNTAPDDVTAESIVRYLTTGAPE